MFIKIKRNIHGKINIKNMMEDKKGRKYDRAKWGWKDESELEIQSYHPYYDSDRKKLTEKYSMIAIVSSVISMIILTTIFILLK
jgi:hypothetical protein